MYTAELLKEKLEKAKGDLREVDDHLLKVDGKPANTTLRYVRSDFKLVQNWYGAKRDDHNNDENLHDGDILGRKVLKTVHEDASRRPFGGSSRRRHVSVTSQELVQPRKRMFPSVDYDEDSVPDRKKAFQSVVAKVTLPDLNVSLKRGREKRDREREDDAPESSTPRPRNVFSRLSGPTDGDLDEPEEEEQEDDDEIIMKRQPVVSSIVEAIERPTPSREEVIASQTQDEVRMKRDKRMFGCLVGTLQQFRRDETKVKQRDERRLQIEKKLEEDAKRDKERMFEEKRQLQLERKKRESDIKRIEWSLNRVKEFDAWQTSMLPLKNFIQTKGQFKIFYLPKLHNSKTEKLLEESVITVQNMIDTRLSNLNEEIETSEKKAMRLTGEEGDINKENEELVEGDNDEKTIGVYEDQIDDEINLNVKEDSDVDEIQVTKHVVDMEKNIKIEEQDNNKQNDKDIEKNGEVIQRSKGENKAMSATEEAIVVLIDLDSPLKPELPAIPTEIVRKSKSPVRDEGSKVSKNGSSKEREKSSVKKSNSPAQSRINKTGLESKAKESTTDHTKTNSGKSRARPRSRSRSRGDRKTNRARRSRSLSKRRRSRSRSRSIGRRRIPKRSPARRRRESPRRRLFNDRSNRRTNASKRSGRKSSRSRSRNKSSSSTTSSN